MGRDLSGDGNPQLYASVFNWLFFLFGRYPRPATDQIYPTATIFLCLSSAGVMQKPFWKYI